jgi:hypothetical protein
MRHTILILLCAVVPVNPSDAQQLDLPPGPAYTSPREKARLDARRLVQICEGYPINPSDYATLELQPTRVGAHQPALLGNYVYLVKFVNKHKAIVQPVRLHPDGRVSGSRRVSLHIFGAKADVGDHLRGCIVRRDDDSYYYDLVDDQFMKTALDMAVARTPIKVIRGKPVAFEPTQPPRDEEQLRRQLQTQDVLNKILEARGIDR